MPIMVIFYDPGLKTGIDTRMEMDSGKAYFPF